MTYQKQVDKSHYVGKAYSSVERWVSYWHQLELVRSCAPTTVLEVGIGAGIVARELRSSGVTVTTLDIAEDLSPDLIGSVTAIPADTASFDVVLAAEILEHIAFEDVPRALSELARTARTHVVLSVPHPGYVFLFSCKVPLLPYTSLFFKIPFFWKTHQFNGEHYWELGKKGYSHERFISCAQTAGLSLRERKVYPDDPAHCFFVFTKSHEKSA